VYADVETMDTSERTIEDPTTPARRPLKTRGSSTVRRLAAGLAARGVAADAISIVGVGFAAVTAGCLVSLGASGADPLRGALLLAAAGTIQLRLLCNLLDGLVAIEGGRRSPTGELFNELPDRVSDVLALVAAGYAVTWIGWAPELAWAAALGAVLTAYVRALGGSLGLAQDFSGPLAKPHRMALLSVACVASLAELAVGFEGRVLTLALALIATGSLLTCGVRLRHIARALKERT
jgi:phosphatidylglycerophosphate synthase